MQRSQPPKRQADPSRTRPLPGLPQDRLTPQEQMDALQRLASQAEERVQLGVQLFKAAEAHTLEHRRMAEQIRADQKKLREEVNEDVTRTLHAYDQWVGQIDESFTGAIRDLESRIDKLQSNWQGTQERIEQMLKRSEDMLKQNRNTLQQVTTKVTPPKKTKLNPEIVTRPDPKPKPTKRPKPVILKTNTEFDTTSVAPPSPQPVAAQPVAQQAQAAPVTPIEAPAADAVSPDPDVVTVQKEEMALKSDKLYTNLLAKLRNQQK